MKGFFKGEKSTPRFEGKQELVGVSGQGPQDGTGRLRMQSLGPDGLV